MHRETRRQRYSSSAPLCFRSKEFWTRPQRTKKEAKPRSLLLNPCFPTCLVVGKDFVLPVSCDPVPRTVDTSQT